MPRASLRVLAVAAATAVGGVAWAGCGDDGGLLPRAGASELQADLDAVAAAVAGGRCEEAQAALAQVRGDLVNLPEDVDPDLRARLREGVDNLARRVPVACPAETAPEPEVPQPEETQPEETQPPETQPEETQPEETQPEETQPEETQPEETQPTEPAPGDEGDGSGGTGGASPDGDEG